MVSLHRRIMEQGFTYRQDTARTIIPLKKTTGFPQPQDLNIERKAPVSLTGLPARETTEKKTDTVEIKSQTQGPSAEQLRNWWWQREKNLLIGDSRYISSRTETQITTSLANNNTGFQLPVRQVNVEKYDWLTLVFLILLVLLASVRLSWGKYLVSLFHSVVNYSTSNRMYQEKNSSLLHGAFRLDILFCLVFAAFIFQLFNYFRIDIHYRSFSLYLFSLTLVLGYIIFKKLIYRFSGMLFEKPAETGEYLFNLDIFNRVTGLILFPVVSVIAFYPFSNTSIPIFTGVFVVAVLYILLLSRGFLILLKKQFSIFYLFLYFCTLEFLPLVLLYKILVV